MKTRTLLLLAVGCGLIILVAGSIKLFLIADDKAPVHLAVGQSGKAGDMTVAVQSVHRTAGETLVEVRLVGADDIEGALSFTYNTGAKSLPPQGPPAGQGNRCAATSVTAPTVCVLAFETARVPGVLGYRRAGETLRWDITG